MGKLKVIKTGPLATIQDFGRFGFRRFGVPQSGAMDREWMVAANRSVGNPDNYPVVEFAMMGMKLDAVEQTKIAVIGAPFKVNGETFDQKVALLSQGDSLEVLAPDHVYSYLAIGGQLKSQTDFESASTYALAGFGGVEGRILKSGDVLISDGLGKDPEHVTIPTRNDQQPIMIRVMKGPEWNLLKEDPDGKTFEVDVSSDRMGVRLIGKLACDYREIASSAVVPGTIQLPANGHPIILMNDCQTTGGYPRIGKVVDEDLGKLAQIKGGKKFIFNTAIRY